MLQLYLFQPLHLIKIPHSIISTSESLRFTKRRRFEQLANIREILSICNTEEQMADEIKKVPAEERESLMRD
uniref:Uncharacterized protein n=1 Tax=Amphimedon queenslandica TaxID=400682 RepID=A0A1X7TMZ6_AMPQE